MKTYVLENVQTNENMGIFRADELRAEVEKLAGGNDWGWRQTTLGAEAVSDHITIARATELA